MTATIFALASGVGRSAIAVYRLSGPLSGPVLRTLSSEPLPPPRQAALRILCDSKGDAIDQALVLWFPAPASFTGEDVVELHLHGGRAVGQAIVSALLAQGMRPAEPGEFSRRAFEAGKFDLTQAEAIADLVAADTAAQRRQALVQMEGALGRLYEEWREALLRAQADIEAAIDFAEEDLPAGLIARAQQTLAALAQRIMAHLGDAGVGERLREGLRVVLLGAPNAGKSSLLNHLAGRDAAIVSATAGTTRDVIEIGLDLGGYPLTLIDTAGLRDDGDAIEQEGVRRARKQAGTADIILLLLDGAFWPEIDGESLQLLASLIPKTSHFVAPHRGNAPVTGIFHGRHAAGVGLPALDLLAVFHFPQFDRAIFARRGEDIGIIAPTDFHDPSGMTTQVIELSTRIRFPHHQTATSIARR